ncbi:MAG: hypothetical protein ACI3U8_00935 [Candidatus Onthomonas sp.]
MRKKKSKSVAARTAGVLAIVVAVLLAIFLLGRYGWKLGGFRACQGAAIEAVEVTDRQVSITGCCPGSFPEGFLGYHAEESDGTLYVGFRFSGLFGFFETGDFSVSIPVQGEIRAVVMKTAANESLIWEAEDAQVPDEAVDETPDTVEDIPAGTPDEAPAEAANEAPDETPDAAADETEADAPAPDEQPTVLEAYATVIGEYYTALDEGWDAAELMEAGLNYMAADSHHGAPLEEIGYAVTDLDGDGTEELAIGSMVEDEFFGKMIFSLYTLDGEGVPQLLFDSTERNRYYYAGGFRFANLGSSGWNDSFVTTLKLEDKELIDMTYTTDPADYVQMELTPFSQWVK